MTHVAKSGKARFDRNCWHFQAKWENGGDWAVE